MEEEQLHVVHHIVTIGVDAVHGEEEEVVAGLPATDHTSVSASVILLVQPCEEGLERQLGRLAGDGDHIGAALRLVHAVPQSVEELVLVTAGSQLGVVASILG